MRVGEPCPVCLQPGGPKVDAKQATCSPENILTHTRTEAWALPHDEPVVMIEGRSGAVALRALVKP